MHRPHPILFDRVVDGYFCSADSSQGVSRGLRGVAGAVAEYGEAGQPPGGPHRQRPHH